MIKLNLGASPIWFCEGWHTLDHKLKKSTKNAIAGDATNIDLPDNSCDVIFCSHVFEHIPHIKLPIVISEINRVLKPGGILRMLTPDLEKIAKAYVNKDVEFFKKAKDEDESLREDLGMGGSFVNFIVSPGQDTVLLDRDLKNFIAGYAHVYSYDYEMIKILFNNIGFECRKADFNDCVIEEIRIPLHIIGLDPVWQNLNQKFYEKNKLTHKLINGKYHINFKLTGFDRDPLTSLIVEAKKINYVNKEDANEFFNASNKNYNRYAFSLLKSNSFISKLKEKKIKFD